MTFTTLTFAIFLGLVFSVYWTIRRRMLQNVMLVVASYAFYSWWDYRFAALMIISTLVDFGVGLGLNKAERMGVRRLLLGCSIAANLGMLGFFKYFNFFAENLQAAANTLGWTIDPITIRVVLPVGISFYTFQTMSYSFDVYFRKMRATDRFVDYTAYVSFFPQLVAGPIERARNLLPQFLSLRRFDGDRAADGCRLILWGFFKKLVIADRLGLLTDSVYGNLQAATGFQIAFATVTFAFQIYCDFSAYSDIARGTARLFGFELMRNFAYPYLSRSVAEFWRRWHISLSTWFRDYVYIPLGGSRLGRAMVVRNILITFVLSGLWHGASWNFVIWGAIMAFGILPGVLRPSGGPRMTKEDVPGGEGRLPSRRNLMHTVFTFAIICFGWVFFRTHTLPEAILALEKMCGGLFDGASWASIGKTMFGRDGRNATIALLAIIVVEWIQRRKPHPLRFETMPRGVRWVSYTALFWLVLLAGPRNVSPFIYFQF